MESKIGGEKFGAMALVHICLGIDKTFFTELGREFEMIIRTRSIGPALAAGFFAAMATISLAADPPAKKLSPYVAPLPAVAAYASAHGIPLDRIEIAADPATPHRTGDSVTALITLIDGDNYRQWLLQAVTVELNAKERRQNPAPMVLFTSTGNVVRFEGARMALDLRLTGPFGSRAPIALADPGTERARALVNADFLGLGFDRTCRTWLRLIAAMRAAKWSGSFDFRASTSRPPTELAVRTKAQADAFGLERTDEPALAGMVPALVAFFDVVQKSPGLMDILKAMLDKTSLAWSALTHGGKLNPSFQYNAGDITAFDAEKWGQNLPAAYRLSYLFSLNDHPTLACQMIVTAPQPPLLTTAGILGLVAERPGDPNRHLVVRVLAARLAPSGRTSADGGGRS